MRPMFRFALFSLISTVFFTGCSRSPGAREAAVKLTVTYNFRTQCLVVTAKDANGSGETKEQLTETLKDFAEGSERAVLAVFRKEGWGRTLKLTAAAYESPACQGAPLVEKELTVPLPETQIVAETLDLAAPDEDGDGYLPTSAGGTDCDDTATTVHPGATEICDDRDNDCDGGPDEGVSTTWYPDQDGDSYGDMNATPLVRCTQPAAYVQDHSDCLDSNANVYPRKDVTETSCNEVDDDCDGVVDDGFPQKETACSQPCPGGKWVCSDNQSGVTCQGSPPKAPYYPDADGDGLGDETSSGAGLKCPLEPFPTGTVANKGDCDDQDPVNGRGNAESCDARDNNCNALVDEDNACMGKGWKTFSDDAALKGRNWRSVSIASNGWVWVAGENGVLAVRQQAGGAFTSFDGKCGPTSWNAAWVRGDGAVYLAGQNGTFAWHDGTNCQDITSTDNSSALTSLIGGTDGGSTRLFAVNTFGEGHSWTPGNTVTRHFDEPSTYFGVHAASAAAQLLLVGGTHEYEPNLSDPLISSVNLTQLTQHTVSGVSSPYGGYLRAVWMISPSLAYAVGDKGLVLKWDGNKTWSRVNLPADNPVAGYTSVAALNPSSIYITDTEGRVRLLKPRGWAPAALYDGPEPLRDIAVKAPDDIWAVGDNGLVVHFAE
jgi:hypothetical protein